MAVVHLIQPLVSTTGGAQLRALMLFELLSERCEVHLWTEHKPAPELVGRYPIKEITPNHHPKSGNIVFVGCYYYIGNWVERANPRRVVVIYNSHNDDDLRNTLAGLERAGVTNVDVAYASEGNKKRIGDIDGPVHPSPISRERFSPRPNRSDLFTVGRIGRNDWSKEHPDDPAFFQELLNRGYRVRIMGCNAKKWGLPEHPNLDLLDLKQEDPEDFLNTLHAFHFRGHPDWFEAWGRVGVESMLCGVPVVGEDGQGYTDYLSHEQGGYLFRGNEQALEQIEALRSSPELWQRQSQLAIEAADRALDPAKIEEMLDFYEK